MAIRPACRSDLPAIARLCAITFWDDELFGDLMHPHRGQYPKDFEAFFTRRVRENWWDYSHLWYVATVREKDAETVVGFAEWEPQGRAGDELRLAQWDPRRIIKPMLHAFNTITTWIYPNHAANEDPELRDPMPGAHEYTSHYWSGERANNMYLDLLAVDPKYRRQGHGRKLVQWGLDRAREEGICASVVSSASGYKFYQDMGFRSQVGMATEGDRNPLRGISSGWILFTNAPPDAGYSTVTVASG